MRVDISLPNLREYLDEVEGDIAQAATEAMRETTPFIVAELRSQIVSAGLGVRLSNSWRGNVYPKGGRSIEPAGFIYSNAPAIVEAFSRGATIRPVNGAKYLWIPTPNVPAAAGRYNRAGRRLAAGRMTPEEVEDSFNTDWIFRRGKNGTVLAFIDAVKAKSGRGFRPGTKRRAAQGRTAKPILMFVLRRTVRMPKLLDLEGPTRRWAADWEMAFARNRGAK